MGHPFRWLVEACGIPPISRGNREMDGARDSVITEAGGSVAGRRRRRTTAEGCVVACTEAAPIFLWWANGWVAEARMALNVGSQAGADVATSGFNAVVIALMRNRAEFGWGRRHDNNRPRVRTPGGHRHREQQSSESDSRKGESKNCTLRHLGDLVIWIGFRAGDAARL